ncbi:MAG: O-antigen ligase family protein [Planctomycetaceae bacterium]|nr:hypothetical protein [Planctomycetaceae bacterium]
MRDVFGRFDRFYDAAGLAGAIIVILLLLALLIMTIAGKRWWLLTIFVAALMFSGHVNDRLDSGSTLLRWAIMFLMALTALRGIGNPGLAAIMLGTMAIVGLVGSFRAPSLFFAIQKSGLLFILVIPMASAMAASIQTRSDVRRFLLILLFGSSIFLVLALASLGELRGSRFGGATKNAPLFVQTGGMLLPVVLWATLAIKVKWLRAASAAIGMGIATICVLSGQRTGTFAGFIACVPLVGARLGIKRLLMALVIVAATALVAYQVLSLFPAQKEFVMKRFTSADTTGRMGLWQAAYEGCLTAPWLGHGVGSNATLGFGFHNAYLGIWYDQGLLGLSLYAGALLALLGQSLRLMLPRHCEEDREYGRLFAGIMLGSIVAAFFEVKLDSPSNFFIFMTAAVSVMVSRLAAIDSKPVWQETALPPYTLQERADPNLALLIQSYYA